MGSSNSTRNRIEAAVNLARFLRNATVYPPANPRVGRSREVLIESLKPWLDGGECFNIACCGNNFQADSLNLDLEGPDLTWLRVQFLNVRIRNLELGPGLTEDSLNQLVDALVRNRQRVTGMARSGEPWSERITGITVNGNREEGPPESPPSEEDLLTGLLEMDQKTPFPVARIRAVLDHSDSICSRLQAVAALAGEHVFPHDILFHLLECLPPQKLTNQESSVDLVEVILDTAGRTLATMKLEEPEQGNAIARQAIVAAAIRALSTGGARRVTPLPEGTLPRRDLGPVVMEEILGSLATMGLEWSGSVREGLAGEVMAAHLHLLLGGTGQEARKKAGTWLMSRLVEADAEELQVFSDHYRHLEREGQGREAILDGLAPSQLVEYIRRRGN